MPSATRVLPSGWRLREHELRRRARRGAQVLGWILSRPAGQLTVVLILAAALRIPGLTAFILEQDELYTVIEGRDLFAARLDPGIEARPLYFLLQHLLLQLLPETALGLRLVPFLFGMAGIAAVWTLGARFFGAGCGVVASALVAVSPWHMHASGMARYWSLLFLLGAGFAFFLVRAYTWRRPADFRIALALLTIGTATHPTFALTALGIAAGVSAVRDDGRLGIRLPPPVAWRNLWGPYLAFVAAAALALRLSGNESAVQNWSGRGWLSTLRLIPTIVEWATPTLVVVGGLGALAVLRASALPMQRRLAAMAIGGSLSTVLLLLYGSLRTDVYADYAIAMLPLLFVSAGALVELGIARMDRGRVAAAWLAVAALAAGGFPSTVSHLLDGTRFDYRPAYRHVERVAPDLLVVTWPVVVQQRYAPGLRSEMIRPRRDYLDAVLRREGEFWLIASVRRVGIVADDRGEIARWIPRHCRRELSHQRPRLDFRQYRVDLHRCGGAPPAG